MIEHPNQVSSRPHITLNSSGGIALGAFMAGVFFEIIKEALQEEHFIVDIITGASAGAMTGAIASYYLLQETEKAKKAFAQPQGNALYEAWVTEADMENIDSIRVMPREELEVFKKDREPFSLLSGKAIENIANLIKPPSGTSPFRIVRPLALLMTVTNLQGLLLKNAHASDKSVSSAEVRKFYFSPGLEQDSEFANMWQKVIDSCRASGAFPVAFPPIKDRSDPKSENFQNLNLSNDYFENSEQQRSEQELTQVLDRDLPVVVEDGDQLKLEFSYSDGGILDNLPILKGIELEANLVGEMSNLAQNSRYQEFENSLSKIYAELKLESKEIKPQERTKRYHVYVQPNPVINLQKPERLLQTSFTLWEMAFSGLTLPHKEHEAIQLQEILDLQQQVELKQDLSESFSDNEELKAKLKEAIPYQPINLSSITPLIINQIKEKNLQELKPLYDALIENSPLIEDGLGKNGSFADPEKLLASDFIRAFGGFFDKKYREHDFVLGRICGLTWLRNELQIPISNDSLEQLKSEIKLKILPQSPRIKPSYRVRLLRIFLRFIRISILELKPVGLWIVVYYLLLIPTILLLRLLELLVTIVLWILKDVIERLFDN